MIINGKALLEAAPIEGMLDHKVQAVPCSYGLTECGYDIRIAEDIWFGKMYDDRTGHAFSKNPHPLEDWEWGNFTLGSSIEYFHMPDNLMGRVLNKSTWARQGLDASMTTNIEPGWNGNLTIELIYHGNKDLYIPAGAGICQVIFELIKEPTQYVGKYQNQQSGPQPAITGEV